MTHFFAGLDISAPPARAAGADGADGADGAVARQKASEAEMAAEDLVCEEIILEQFNDG
jgi:hypothetical protein